MARYSVSPRSDRRHFRKTAQNKKIINAGVLYRGGIRL